jgi:hypothetical protein
MTNLLYPKEVQREILYPATELSSREVVTFLIFRVLITPNQTAVLELQQGVILTDDKSVVPERGSARNT